VTAPGVDKSSCYKDSTNIQFQYETEEKLQQQLAIDYGQVRVTYRTLWITAFNYLILLGRVL